ncbi:MAG: hypothetical protein JKY43_07665 [Phycisphaerales bacterium]|nr:hypothetical protein [Phycisphaerales bacterium]
MAFYQVTGQDHRTRSQRTLDISANSADDAVFTAVDYGLIEVKVDLLSDRDLLHKDLACFLYADPMATKRVHAIPVNANFPASALLDHPILTIGAGVLLGFGGFRLIEMIVTRLITVLF